ncbi:MAG: hypothetical protein CMH49_09420 [Myxococcales bacterium]|nr:hypothetical protein [Myxococcales bacterium]
MQRYPLKSLKDLHKDQKNGLQKQVSELVKDRSGIAQGFSFDWSKILNTPALSLVSIGKDGGSQSIAQSWGESFRELTPYTHGANPKGIHWPRWIQRQELTLKQYDLPQQGKLCIVIDESGSMSTGRQYHYARICAAKLAIACVKAGHQVQIFIEREAAFHQTPVANKIEHVINIFSTLDDQPSGLSASLENRAKSLAPITSQDYLIYISDALFTIAAPLNKEENKTNNEKLSTVIEQLGPSIKAMYCFYVCCIDPTADRPDQHEKLCSAESSFGADGSLNHELAELVYQRLIRHRQTQRSILLNQRSKIQWFELNTALSFDAQFQTVTAQLRQS